jgi:hypothetical protein
MSAFVLFCVGSGLATGLISLPKGPVDCLNIHSITQDYWAFWTFPSSGILETRKHDISETGSVSVLK